MMGNAYSGAVLEVQRMPQLQQPVLVVALSGWVDAGMSGQGAISWLVSHAERSEVVAHIDLSEIADLQRARPTVHVEGGVFKTLTWPRIEVVAGSAGGDFLAVRGPEPARMWMSFAAEVVDFAREAGAHMGVGLAGMPSMTSHRRPVRVMATATSSSLAQELGPIRPDYQGPTGAQTAVQMALGEAGVPAIGLWSQVPHYLAGMPCPPAVRSLLERLLTVTGLRADLQPLDATCDEYLAGIEQLARFVDTWTK